MTRPGSPGQAALRACIYRAVRTANWLVGLFAGAAALAVFGRELHAIGPWVVIAATAAGAAVGVRLGVRRARRLVAGLPPGEAVEVLRPFARHDDEVARQVATALLRGLAPPNSEMVAVSPLPARGDEAAPAL